MRRKYFMRGMGVGIVITALVFSISTFFTKGTMSPSQIIAEAEKLGMVMPESETLNDKKNESTEDKKEDNITETTNENGDKVTTQTVTGDDVTPAPNETTDPTTEENKTNEAKPEDSKAVTFSIKGGENSEVISANLHKAGLIDNPSKFNDFLEKNGYDKNLKVGSYSISPGSSEESIAKKLTGK